MAIRINNNVSITIDTGKISLDEFIAAATNSIRVRSDERVMMRLAGVYRSSDQREMTTATIELSVEKKSIAGTGSSVTDPRGPNA